MNIRRFDIYKVSIPFRVKFEHARSSRVLSSSIFVRAELGNGTLGYGESLPREYVTGETLETSFDLLAETVLPLLLDCDFSNHGEVEQFCSTLYTYLKDNAIGLPAKFGATCCAAELALLDSFGRHFGCSAFASSPESDPVYSGVISAGGTIKAFATAWLCRRAGLHYVKLKVGGEGDERLLKMARRVLGANVSIRVDANMAWDVPAALEAISRFQQLGVQYAEQPLPVGHNSEMHELHEKTGALIIADESVCDVHDARELINSRACQAFNIRVSKCGGFFESLRIGRIARENGVQVQIGCQVGESALLSAVGLALARRLSPVVFAEGCFGERLLLEDLLSDRQPSASVPFVFGKAGRAPEYDPKAGIGIDIDETRLKRYVCAHRRIERVARARLKA